MWIVRGILLGLVIFFVYELLYLYFQLRPEPNKATAVSLLLSLTIWNTGFWLVLVVALFAACAIVKEFFSTAR